MTTPAEKDAMALAVLLRAAGIVPSYELSTELTEARAHLAARVAEQTQRIAQLEANENTLLRNFNRAEAELAAVREALSFYANAANYYAQPGAGNAIRQDQGNLARAVLAGKAPFLPTYAIDAARGAK